MKIYIDKVTGTWGDSEDIVILNLEPKEVDKMDSLSDSEIIELANGPAGATYVAYINRMGR